MKRNCMNPCLTDSSLMKEMVKMKMMMKMSQSVTEQREKKRRKKKDEKHHQTEQGKDKLRVPALVQQFLHITTNSLKDVKPS